ncbi:hypothetical protein BG000_002059 [Podila horticola]|nr:hypothetical protein BG003_011572 [Podila horticola]KAG0342714.1 hypothetical protein BG000_002059 [Podila horticola]
MKSSFIIATLALAASVTAQSASDIDAGNKWCGVFTAACTQSSGSANACGPNFVSKANTCQSVFTNGKCTQYRAYCACATAAGIAKEGTEVVLKSTFAATQGQCADLEMKSIPVNSTSSSTAGATATSTGTSPSGTAAPGKGSSAGKTATNAFLAVAAAVGAAALAL